MKKYRAGMYGGKFMPFHKGHLHCLQVASEMCDIVYLVLVIGGSDEERIRLNDDRFFLTPIGRFQRLKKVEKMFDNVYVRVIGVSKCRDADGNEDWDMETPIMLREVGHFDAVFGSEPEYKPYFNRAYPWAEYVLVDPDRKDVPISATQIREMSTKEMAKWIV